LHASLTLQLKLFVTAAFIITDTALHEFVLTKLTETTGMTLHRGIA
jgi:hypothetical protein